MNNSKLCQELFANHFEVGYVMIHDVTKDRTVEFSVNPLDRRQVRFTYFDRMVHDALYTIYQDYLNKNEGARNGCEINYQLLLKVMTGNSQQTNLKREGSLRLILRDSLLKLAATDIYIDASIRGARTKPNVFFGKLVNLEQLPQAAEDSENAKRHDDRFVISGNMPLFDYANSIGRRSGQIVYYPAEAMGYAVAKLDRAEGNFPRELIVLSEPVETVTYGRKAEADPEPQEVYRNTVNRMMIKHYMMRKIMVIRRGKCPENFKIVNYLSTLNPRKNPGSQGMVMDLFGTYYKLHSRRGENSAEMIHHFSTDSVGDRNKQLMLLSADTELCKEGDKRHHKHCHIAAEADAVKDYSLDNINRDNQTNADDIRKISTFALCVEVSDIPSPVFGLRHLQDFFLIHNNNSFGFVCQVLLSLL